jgi:hypothetical protein
MLIPDELRQQLFLYFPSFAIYYTLTEKDIFILHELPSSAQKSYFLFEENNRKDHII